MKATIISIGDELLIGQTINTNASWLGSQLAQQGITIYQVITISDEHQEIINQFDKALEGADIVLVTGGLGPTKDDITKHALCEFYQTELEMHQPTLDRVTAFFEKRNRKMLEVNTWQAMLPKKCTPLANLQGTAPGMWFEEKGKILVSMPGVPYEMKGIFSEEVLPRLAEKFPLKKLFYKTVLTVGIGESYLADRMQKWESEIRNEGLGLAYLPSPGMVKLRISSQNGKVDEAKIDGYFAQLKAVFPQFYLGSDQQNLSNLLGKMLRTSSATVGTIESCTGGAVANYFVQTPGSSDYFQGALITYSHQQKVNLAHVNEAVLSKYGAVSQEVAEEMAVNGRQVLGVDYAISTTGIAGSNSSEQEEDTGVIWVAIADKEGVASHRFHFGDNRERNIHMTTLNALNLLRCRMLRINFEKK